MIILVGLGAICLPIFIKGLLDNRKIMKELGQKASAYNNKDLDYMGNLGLNEGTEPRVRCPAGKCWVPQSSFSPDLTCPQCDTDDKITSLEFQHLAELEDLKAELNQNSYRLEEWFWEEQILMPERLIWCNGYPLEPMDPKDLKRFLEIKNQAYLKGDYNSVPLDEGGKELLEIDWLRLQGCSHDGAVKLLELGVKPWEFEW